MKKISVEDLKEGMISDQTICDKRGMVLVAKGLVLTKTMIQRLRNFDVAFIEICDETDELPEACSTDTVIAKQTLADTINLTYQINELRALTVKDNMEKIETVIYSVLKRSFIQEFLEVCSKTSILYQHTLRTTILAVHLGLIKQYDTLNLEYIAMCALLHDCGMNDEFHDEDKEHPFLGFVKLRENPQVDMVIALACLQHHEYYNGTGFPFSFSRTQISEFSSLLSIVDYYDRLIIGEVHPRKALFDTIGKKKILFPPDAVELLAGTIDWTRLYQQRPLA
ncbi:MAG: HD domain-containing protein [Sporomusaceae bacterium]|nr:HD domain-containing protein [Sporomusaceae bacterium]